MDSEWKDKYPMVYVRALEHIEKLSDHAPILLTTGTPRPLCMRPFKFQLGWLHRDDFLDMVKNVRERPIVGNSPIVRWNNKMCAIVNTSLVGLHISAVFLKNRRLVYRLLLMI
jgi:hypothetical protein